MADIMNDETIGEFKKSWFLNAKVPDEDQLYAYYDNDKGCEYDDVFIDEYGNILRRYCKSVPGFNLLGCKDLDFAICSIKLEKDGSLNYHADVSVAKACENDRGWSCMKHLILNEKGEKTETFLEFDHFQEKSCWPVSDLYLVPYTDLDPEAFRDGEVALTQEAEEKWKKILLREIPAPRKTENQANMWTGTPTDYCLTINEYGKLRDAALYSDSKGLFIKGDALYTLELINARKAYIYIDDAKEFVQDISQIKPSPETWLIAEPEGRYLYKCSCDIVSIRKKDEAPSINIPADVSQLDTLLHTQNTRIRKIEETKDLAQVLCSQETVISNMLAYLLHYQYRKKGHGFKEKFLKTILNEYKVPFAAAEMGKGNPDLWLSFGVYREVPFEDNEGKGVIDILCVSEKQKFVLCIEHNMGSGEYANRLTRSASFVEKHFCAERDFEALFVYLTPWGDIPADARWKTMRYRFIYEMLQAYNEHGARDIVHPLYTCQEMLYKLMCKAGRINTLLSGIFDSEMKEKLKKDFPSLEERFSPQFPSRTHILFSDSSLKEYAPIQTCGEDAGETDLFFIAITLEAYEQVHGVLSCVLTFTNHAANTAAEGSAFRKKFNPKNGPFNRFDAIRIEEPLLHTGESFDRFQKDDTCHERFYTAVKTLLSKMKEEITARGL